MNAASGLRHIVLCAFQSEATAETIALLARQFARLKEDIPGVRHFECGSNVSTEGLDNGFTHCFAITFDDAAARDAYLPHPAHLAFVDQLKPWLDKVQVFDYFPQENPD